MHEESRRRAGPPLRQRAAGRRPAESPSGRHQPLRFHAPDVPGARGRGTGDDRRADLGAARDEGSRRSARQAGDAAQAGGSRQVPAPGSERTRTLPGGRASGRRRQPGSDPVSHHMAGRRRPLHHAADGDHPRPRPRDPQRGDVPDPGARPRHAGDALAAPQGRCRPLARDGSRRRAHAGRDRPGRRSREHLLGLGSAPADHRRVPLRRVSPARARGPDPRGDLRPRGAFRGGAGPGGLHRSGGAAGAGGPVRRPHRLLLARGLLPQGARHRGHGAARSDLSGHARRPAADGGLLPRTRDRADLPAAAAAHRARDRGLSHARPGHLPQPGVRLDRQAVPGTGLQGDERALGAGTDVARQGPRRGGQGRERARSRRGLVDRAQQHRSRAGRALHHGSGGCARSRQPRLHLRQQDGDRRHPEVEGRGLRPRVARPHHDGRGNPAEGGRDVAAARDLAGASASPCSSATSTSSSCRTRSSRCPSRCWECSRPRPSRRSRSAPCCWW